MESQNRKYWVESINELLLKSQEELLSKGYTPTTIYRYLQIFYTFQQWCETQAEILLETSIKNAVKIYLNDHFTVHNCKKKSCKYRMSHAALGHLCNLVISMPEYYSIDKISNINPVETELLKYDQYLQHTCGLSLSTRNYRRRIVGEFLSRQFGSDPIDYRKLTSQHLMQYVSKTVQGYKPGTASVIASSIRSYMKYLQFRGDIDPSLVSFIPSPPHWRMSDYPVVLSESQIKELINAFDITSPSGMRDHAILLCMLYMGLRASEVASLSLDDINWRQSILNIYQSKSHTFNELPLLNNCGSSIARYLKNGRSFSKTRKVFVRHTVPVGSSMKTENVRGAMRRAYARAGFPENWTGTHLLRHTAATHMLNSGATLKQIADVLGHQSIDTSFIYTKVNINELKTVSQPWPRVQ